MTHLLEIFTQLFKIQYNNNYYCIIIGIIQGNLCYSQIPLR